ETVSRNVRCLPLVVLQAALAGETLRVDSFDGLGDWIHAADVAEALSRLLRAPTLLHGIYNVAYGSAETLRVLVDAAAAAVPLAARETQGADANVVSDPDRRPGRWGGYDASRLQGELGWRAAPLRQRILEYARWLREHEADMPQPQA